MKEYIFLVRPWNVDFFLQLEKLIQAGDKECNINYWTLQLEAFDILKKHSITAVYLPVAFENTDINDEIVANADSQMNNQFNVGINLLYEIERYKVDYTQTYNFIAKQVCFFHKNIVENAELISLTCDHFTYILAGYQNSLKSGRNCFVHPIGFPMNANVITSNPWDLNRYREIGVDFSEVGAYLKTLSKTPQQTLHYMQPQRQPSFFDSLKLRWMEFQKNRPNRGLFNYLEKHPKKLKISRLQKTKTRVDIDYITFDFLQEISNIQKVFYFPLQYEPEMSILAYSPFFKDQMEVIRLISQSLRHGDLLVLKENPKMFDNRDKSFYLKTLKFPNVRWLNPKENSREIIKICYKTVSITGTATIEAAVLGKNSLIFGYPPFRSLLIQIPVSEEGLTKFKETLYIVYGQDQIEKHLNDNWPEFSKALFFGDFIPKTIGLKTTISNAKSLATSFFNEVLSNAK